MNPVKCRRFRLGKWREAIGTAQGDDQEPTWRPCGLPASTLTSRALHINVWHHLLNTENLREPHIDLESVHAWLLSVLNRVMMIYYVDFLSKKQSLFPKTMCNVVWQRWGRFPKQRWMLIGKGLDRNVPRRQWGGEVGGGGGNWRGEGTKKESRETSADPSWYWRHTDILSMDSRGRWIRNWSLKGWGEISKKTFQTTKQVCVRA